ncbi:hypothetical protein ACLOJK_016803 [Asimina triloba]
MNLIGMDFINENDFVLALVNTPVCGLFFQPSDARDFKSNGRMRGRLSAGKNYGTGPSAMAVCHGRDGRGGGDVYPSRFTKWLGGLLNEGILSLSASQPPSPHLLLRRAPAKFPVFTIELCSLSVESPSSVHLYLPLLSIESPSSVHLYLPLLSASPSRGRYPSRGRHPSHDRHLLRKSSVSSSQIISPSSSFVGQPCRFLHRAFLPLRRYAQGMFDKV